MLKKTTSLAVFLCSAALAFTTTSAFAQSTMKKIVETGKMTIAVQTQGPPVSFINKNGTRTGLAIELAQLMAQDMGVELVIQDYDWKGLIPALTSGKADFIAADMTPTAKRHMQILFTKPVFFSEAIAFAKAEKGFGSWEDLNKAGVAVGTVQATTWSDIARKLLPNAQLKEYAGGTTQTVLSVISGRVDAGISDRATIASHIKANPGLAVLDGQLSKDPLGFAVRPDSLHLLLALDNYMNLIALDGRLNEKLQYWWNSTAWEADHK